VFDRRATFEDLAYGKYTLLFKSIYDHEEKIEFEMESRNKEITLCIDTIKYDFSSYDLLIDRLKSDQSLNIVFETLGCFHSEKLRLEVLREGEQYFLIFNTIEVALDSAQLQLLREFEVELQQVKDGWCTTTDTYVLSIRGDSEHSSLIDTSCSWHGFYNLLEKLELKGNIQ